MNRIVLALLMVVLSLSAFELKTYESALAQQKKTNKLIMIEVVREGCHYCEDMDRDVFANKEMSEWIAKRFIPIKISLNKQDLPLGLKVTFTPTFYFVDKNQKIVKKIPGAWNMEDFKSLTQKIQ
ncbi:MAG: hypothetical protein AUK54_00965 [Helicobacteraceae bacterium CG2_30_36_10]|nr:MAG: hypothetical protein AUK54_00965 [Helicobacteraceae bacterium CG2_30_36_10]